MKKLLSVILALVLVFSLTACGATTSDDEGATQEVKELKFSAIFAATNQKGALEEAWINMLNEKSDTMNITPYWSSTLTASDTSYSETVQGVADIACINPGSESDHFIVENSQTFFLYSDLAGEDAIAAAWDFYNACDEWQAEYEDAHVLNICSNADSLYILANYDIKSLEDLKGKTFQCTEELVFQLVQALGGTAVRLPASEQYDALEKGIIDGVINVPMRISNYSDILVSVVDLGIFAPVCTWHVMSNTAYDSLTAEDQALIDETAVPYLGETMIETANAGREEGFKLCEENGIAINTFSDADLQTIQDTCAELAVAEAERLDGLGYDGTGMYNKAREIVESYKK